MDSLNSPTEIPPASSQITASPPADIPNHHWLLWLTGGVALLGLGIAIGLFSAKFLSQSQGQTQRTSTPSPVQSPVPTPQANPDLAPPDTANWKIYLGETGYTTEGSTIFQISYPPEWKIEKNILYPLGQIEDKGFETRIILGALGHGWVGKTETKEFPAGTAKYSWVNIGQQISAFASFEKDKNTYIIEIVNLPSAYDNEYKILFDQILSTFKFIDKNSPTPSSTNKVQQLTYYLPPGWKTVIDTSGRLEVGYNPNQFSATPGNQNIYLNNISYPVSAMSVTLKLYDGGSHHQFIYKQLGYTAEMAKEERMNNYYEVEYRYSGWSCLVLYGLGFSARGTTWGMCAVNSSQALFIEGGSEEDTKQLISTTKFTQ